MRLTHEPLFLEPRQHVPHGRRRHAERAVLDQPGRRNRLALLDVFADEARQDAALAIGEVRAHAVRISSRTRRVLTQYNIGPRRRPTFELQTSTFERENSARDQIPDLATNTRAASSASAAIAAR